MASSRGGMLATSLAALGAAAIAFALLPGAWPNPLPAGPLAGTTDVLALAAATQSVAEACARGDLRAFQTATTDGHRDRIARRLAAVDGVLDARTLRAIGEEQQRADWWSLPRLGGAVQGRRAFVVVARPAGDGAWMLSFFWNGRTMQFDGVTHLASVRTPDQARAAIQKAFAAR